MATSSAKNTQAFSVLELAQINSNSENDTHMVNVSVVNSFVYFKSIKQETQMMNSFKETKSILLLKIVRPL